MNRASRAAPTPSVDRNQALDVTRGVALLGILVMNVQSYGTPGVAYLNPTATGPLPPLDRFAWLASHVLVDQKFLTLFCVMFGAGITMMAERHHGPDAAPIHYRRMGWLLLIGMLHGCLLWYGDILVILALCGMAAYPFRALPTGRLIAAGLAILAVPSVGAWVAGLTLAARPDVTDALNAMWFPSAETLARETAVYRGGWLAQLPHRTETFLVFGTQLFVAFYFWRALGLMLLGMAVQRMGMMTGGWAPRHYLVLTALGAASGLAAILLGVHRNEQASWSAAYSVFFGSQFNYWGSLALAGAYVGIVQRLCQAGALPRARRWLAAVGRTALSNYLLQTLVCTFLFYGHGLGKFGSFSRTALLLTVVPIWVLEVAVSSLWLRRHRFGPAEWAWRSLTYRSIQPLRAKH